MPDLTDITVYIETPDARILSAPLDGARMGSPFLLRTVQPKAQDAIGRTGGKRLADRPMSRLLKAD